MGDAGLETWSLCHL